MFNLSEAFQGTIGPAKNFSLYLDNGKIESMKFSDINFSPVPHIESSNINDVTFTSSNIRHIGSIQ